MYYYGVGWLFIQHAILFYPYCYRSKGLVYKKMNYSHCCYLMSTVPNIIKKQDLCQFLNLLLYTPQVHYAVMSFLNYLGSLSWQSLILAMTYWFLNNYSYYTYPIILGTWMPDDRKSLRIHYKFKRNRANLLAKYHQFQPTAEVFLLKADLSS